MGLFAGVWLRKWGWRGFCWGIGRGKGECIWMFSRRDEAHFD